MMVNEDWGNALRRGRQFDDPRPSPQWGAVRRSIVDCTAAYASHKSFSAAQVCASTCT
jgi:hypothetical protein